MATDHTKIQWTDATWSPVRGCSIVSAGCTNCYAMKQAHRFSGPGRPYEGLTRLAERGPIWTGKIRLVPEALDQPLRWKRPRRIFVNSMSDLFHEDVPTEFICRVWRVMRDSPHHTFQILTKRPARMLEFVLAQRGYSQRPGEAKQYYPYRPLPSVWLGISAEDQKTADERIPILLQTPAAVRFLSLEPLLGPIDIGAAIPCGYYCNPDPERDGLPCNAQHAHDFWTPGLKTGIGWVIAGGESGPGARPCNIDWLRSLRDQCKAADVPVFLKQLGSNAHGWSIHEMRHGSQLRDRKGGDPLEWPEDLRVREFPT